MYPPLLSQTEIVPPAEDEDPPPFAGREFELDAVGAFKLGQQDVDPVVDQQDVFRPAQHGPPARTAQQLARGLVQLGVHPRTAAQVDRPRWIVLLRLVEDFPVLCAEFGEQFAVDPRVKLRRNVVERIDLARDVLQAHLALVGQRQRLADQVGQLEDVAHRGHRVRQQRFHRPQAAAEHRVAVETVAPPQQLQALAETPQVVQVLRQLADLLLEIRQRDHAIFAGEFGFALAGQLEVVNVRRQQMQQPAIAPTREQILRVVAHEIKIVKARVGGRRRVQPRAVEHHGQQAIRKPRAEVLDEWGEFRVLLPAIFLAQHVEQLFVHAVRSRRETENAAAA